MNNRANIFSRYLLFALIAACTKVSAQIAPVDVVAQKYRPLYHFSPAKGWIGDPDGLVFNDGKYHLFWWGHAVSADLVHWKELPKPMKGDDGSFSYFSGSVAVDKDNTAGFGNNSMVAVFTRHFPGDKLPETQALSVSNNGGSTFNYYRNNPVLDINKIFFRDPQVFWYKPTGLWKMVVTLPDVQQIHIYESPDLKNWKFCSSFGGLGARNSFWECPDLYELPVIGSKEKKWVMMIGRGPNKVQYFVGSFDGKIFAPDAQTVDYLKTGKGLEGLVYDDFENGPQLKWQQTGEAFKAKQLTGQVSDYLGEHYAGSASTGSSTGKMVSGLFKISHKAINFLLAGGDHTNTNCIRLMVNGKVQRSATGDNTKVLKWNGWDVRDLVGKDAYLEIIDNNADTVNAFIAVDQIMFSDKLMDHHLEHALWLDYGPDHYATRIWRNYDESRNQGDSVFAIGWMGNWEYAGKVPTQWGKGFESLPRLLKLKLGKTGYHIVQQPVPQLQQLRGPIHQANTVKLKGVKNLEVFNPAKNSYEIEAVFKPSSAAFGFHFLVGMGRKLILRYDPVTSVLSLDRTNCTDFITDTAFTKLFAKKITAPLNLQDGKLRLHIFLDRSSIEVFANHGDLVLSATTFPSDKQLGIQVFSENGETGVTLKAWDLKTIWDQNK
jgi:fructan beta-fructosidase